MTMRVAMLYDLDDIRIEERAIPATPAGGILVRMSASGICSGDFLPWYIRRKAPLVFGHEPAGVIAEVSAAESPCDDLGREFRTGDRVFVHHHAPCFMCYACARGDYVQCATWRSSAIDPGGMAEFFAAPATNIRDTLRVPEGMPIVDATLVEPLACVVKSLTRSRVAPGDTLYVVGLGVMGLMHVALAVNEGVHVVASDFVPERREAATALGAGFVVDAGAADAGMQIREHLKGHGPDAVVCGPGTAQALQHAIASVLGGGTVVMFTPLEPGQVFEFGQAEAYFRDVTLTASYSCGPSDTRRALTLIDQGHVTAAKLGAQRYAFHAVADAFAHMRAGRVVKAIVTV